MKGAVGFLVGIIGLCIFASATLVIPFTMQRSEGMAVLMLILIIAFVFLNVLVVGFFRMLGHLHETVLYPDDAYNYPQRGRALFLTHCASCHGASARGDGPVASSLRQSPGDLTQFARRNGGVFPSSKVHRIIEGRDVGAHGSVEMPVWGTVFRRLPTDSIDRSATRRIEAIVQYLESIQERTGHEDSAGHR